jgi:hypothetical protein
MLLMMTGSGPNLKTCGTVATTMAWLTEGRAPARWCWNKRRPTRHSGGEHVLAWWATSVAAAAQARR